MKLSDESPRCCFLFVQMHIPYLSLTFQLTFAHDDIDLVLGDGDTFVGVDMIDISWILFISPLLVSSCAMASPVHNTVADASMIVQTAVISSNFSCFSQHPLLTYNLKWKLKENQEKWNRLNLAVNLTKMTQSSIFDQKSKSFSKTFQFLRIANFCIQNDS